MGPTSNNFYWLAKSYLELISNCQLGPASYAYPLPLPFQGIKVNEEDITHAPEGYHAGIFLKSFFCWARGRFQLVTLGLG